MARAHGHYYRDVTTLTEIDVYRVHALFGLGALDPSGALCHASKKILVAGLRGAGKSLHKDVAEAIETLQRFLEMLGEDEAAVAGQAPQADETPLPEIQPGLLQRVQETANLLGPLLPNLSALTKDKAGEEWTDAHEARIDVIGQNGNGGEHYVEIERPAASPAAPAGKPVVPSPALRRADPVKPKAASVDIPPTDHLVDPTGKPKWADLPEWAQYIAQNSKGVWLAFAKRPYIVGSNWVRSRGNQAEVNSGELVPAWRQSMEERPSAAK